MSHARLARVNKLILSTVNEILLTKSKDPRLVGVTITKAIVSGDLSTVRLFYSLMGDVERQAEVEKAFGKATGFIRSYLASSLEQRHTPRLIFERDLNPEYAQKVGALLGELTPASDPETAKVGQPLDTSSVELESEK
jgi:ribosome-binding factor A